MPKQNSSPGKRPYNTDVRAKISSGKPFSLQLVLDDDNALGLYELKEKDPNGITYVKFINTAVRNHLKIEKRKLARRKN